MSTKNYIKIKQYFWKLICTSVIKKRDAKMHLQFLCICSFAFYWYANEKYGKHDI